MFVCRSMVGNLRIIFGLDLPAPTGLFEETKWQTILRVKIRQ